MPAVGVVSRLVAIHIERGGGRRLVETLSERIEDRSSDGVAARMSLGRIRVLVTVLIKFRAARVVVIVLPEGRLHVHVCIYRQVS